MKPLTNETKHIGRMSPETKLTDDVFQVQRFDELDKKGYPKIPISPGLVINQMTKQLQGLFVHSGRVWYKGTLLNLFNEYEPGEGYTGYDVIWFKLRYKGKTPEKPSYVTIMAWDRGTEVMALGSHDGEQVDWVNESIYPVQQSIVKKTLEYLATNEPLPDPPITYQFV